MKFKKSVIMGTVLLALVAIAIPAFAAGGVGFFSSTPATTVTYFKDALSVPNAVLDTSQSGLPAPPGSTVRDITIKWTTNVAGYSGMKVWLYNEAGTRVQVANNVPNTAFANTQAAQHWYVRFEVSAWTAGKRLSLAPQMNLNYN